MKVNLPHLHNIEFETGACNRIYQSSGRFQILILTIAMEKIGTTDYVSGRTRRYTEYVG